MIDVAQQRAALDSAEGELVAVRRTDYAQLLAAVDLGQQARRALTRLKAAVAIEASTSGAPA